MNDTERKFTRYLTICVLLVVAFIAGALYGALEQVRFNHESAIKAGVAEWQINPHTGEKAFVYKSPTPTPNL